MRVPHDVQKALLIFGVSGLLYYLIKSGINPRKPKSSSESNIDKQQADAKIVLSAYMKALKAGESPSDLEELNRQTEAKYGLRTYRKSDGKYYVIDTKGNDIRIS